jgi:predicted ester cyclase
MKGVGSMTVENKRLMRKTIEQLCKTKRADFLANTYTLDCKGRTPDGSFSGIDEFQAFFERYMAAFSDVRIEIQRMIAEEDWVALSYRFVGTNTGPLRGIAPTQNVVDLTGFVFTRIAGQRIAEQYFIWDNLEARRQLGHWYTLTDTETDSEKQLQRF